MDGLGPLPFSDWSMDRSTWRGVQQQQQMDNTTGIVARYSANSFWYWQWQGGGAIDVKRDTAMFIPKRHF